MRQLINKLFKENFLDSSDLLDLLLNLTEKDVPYLLDKAHETRTKVYKDKVFLRGLIEFTSFCKQSCMYCGLRAPNQKADRYRLNLEDILAVCREGNSLGYKTFVLQGGEDNYFTDDKMVEIIKNIKANFPDAAVTLSIGEKDYESYQKYYDAGADRFLLRHETATQDLYQKLHPTASFENRRACLKNLKEIGYQVGAGFMVGLPGQTSEDLVRDIQFLKELEPHMTGIGPFIPHQDTPLKNEKSGTVELTLKMLAITRLFLPKVLLPATTALGTIDKYGLEKGLKAGANVIMPVLTPNNVRKKYALYNGKISLGNKAADNKTAIEEKVQSAGFSVDLSRGDNVSWKRK